jgi:phage terminase large subunit-like protein
LGRRGRGAIAKGSPNCALTFNLPASEPHPWDAPGLSRADRVIAFVETLPVTAGPLAGTTLTLRPWQKRFIRAVYRTDKNGRRLIRTAVLSVARKNGKTQLAAALCLCALSGPEAEPRGECYSVASTRFQAGRVFNEMVAIILRTPWLNERINISRFRKELEDLVNGSTYDVLSADVAPVHGLSPSFVCYDELAQVASRDVYDALGTALGGRANPLLIVISTQAASNIAPMSELVDYGLRIHRGEITDASFHLTLFSAPLDADPWSEKTWKLANPALGDFRSLGDVRRLAGQAQRMPSAEPAFRQLILNQRCDSTAQFLNAALWKACGDQVDIASLKGRPCFAGLALGATRDMSALVLVFADGDGGFDILPFCWLPMLEEREDADHVPYRAWAKQGYLATFEGRSTDPKVIALKIAELHGAYHIEALAFDRWRIEDIRRELDAIGCDVELIPWGQGFRDMGPAVDLLERLVEERKLRHDNSPVMNMAVSNAVIERDAAGNRKLSKRKAHGRIDPLVACAMALGVAARHEAVPVWQPFVEVV